MELTYEERKILIEALSVLVDQYQRYARNANEEIVRLSHLAKRDEIYALARRVIASQPPELAPQEPKSV